MCQPLVSRDSGRGTSSSQEGRTGSGRIPIPWDPSCKPEGFGPALAGGILIPWGAEFTEGMGLGWGGAARTRGNDAAQ